MTTLRFQAWLCVLVAIAVTCSFYGQAASSFDAAGNQRALLAALIGSLSILAVFLTPRFVRTKNTVLAVLLPALLMRLLISPAAPSDDVHRYLWEGKLIQVGEDPYAFPASDPARSPHHDAHWEQMNNRSVDTAYPPLALHTFALINQLGYSAASYKLVFSLLDGFLIAVILALLHVHRRPLKWATFYALSPISLIAFSAEAHFDILMILPLMGAIFAHKQQKFILCAALLAISVHFKIMALIVVPFLLWRTPARTYIAFAIVLIGPCIPYYSHLVPLASAVHSFGANGSFNGPIYQGLGSLTQLSKASLNLWVTGGFCACILGIGIRFLCQRITAIQASAYALGSLLLFSPIIHFWYLSWLLPLVALSPRASWISLSVTSSLYFTVWTHYQVHDSWSLPIYAKLLFWLPFFVLLIYEMLSKRRILDSASVPESSPANSIAIVIPTRNPGPLLQQALDSIMQQTVAANSVIIVDSSQTELKLDPSHSPQINLIRSPASRGLQIKTGVEAAHSADWVLILHADATLPRTAISTLKSYLNNNPKTVAGCLGQRFQSSGHAGLLLVEIMNEVRAVFGRTSFGDQAQFLHRTTAIAKGCLSTQPLMEDVELSDRIRPYGQIAYLNQEVTVSASKWHRHAFLLRFKLIVGYYLRYRLLLWKSPAERQQLAHVLVEEYYPNLPPSSSVNDSIISE